MRPAGRWEEALGGRGAPPAVWGRPQGGGGGAGEGRTQLGDHACLEVGLLLAEKLARWCPGERGDVQGPRQGRAVVTATSTHEVPGAQLNHSRVGSLGEEIPGTDGRGVGHCCGHCWPAAFPRGAGGPSHASGGAQPVGLRVTPHQLPGPGPPGGLGATEETEALEGTLGPGPPGTVPWTPPHREASTAEREGCACMRLPRLPRGAAPRGSVGFATLQLISLGVPATRGWEGLTGGWGNGGPQVPGSSGAEWDQIQAS